MKARDLLLENGTVDSALRRGWVRIRYTRLDGMSRIMLATTNHSLFSYNYRRPQRLGLPKNIILVWEHKVGWRALRRSRIGAWQEAGAVNG